MRGRFEAVLRMDGGNGGQVALALLQNAGLVLPPEQTLSTVAINRHLEEVRDLAYKREALGRMDLSPRNSIIQEVVKEAYPDPVGCDDAKFSNVRERRTMLVQVLAMLLQVPADKRMEESAYQLTPIRSSNGGYGLLYWQPDRSQIIVRLRHRDGTRIKAGLAEIAGLLISRKQLDHYEVSFADGQSAGTSRIGKSSLYTSFGKAVLLAPSREEDVILCGDIQEVRSKRGAVWLVIKNGSPRVLSLIGLAFLALSALAFLAVYMRWIPSGLPLVTWVDQLFGRMATAAFGAVLVDAAIKYTALSRSLRVGDFVGGAVVNWQQPTED